MKRELEEYISILIDLSNDLDEAVEVATQQKEWDKITDIINLLSDIYADNWMYENH